MIPDEALVMKGMEGERLVIDRLSNTWNSNNLDDIKKYCIGGGPDIWKSSLIGIEVKFWSKRFLDKRALKKDVLPRFKKCIIKILVFLYEGTYKHSGYSKSIEKLCTKNGIIPVVIDIEKSEFYKIREMEQKLSRIMPRVFKRVIVNSLQGTLNSLRSIKNSLYTTISSIYDSITSKLGLGTRKIERYLMRSKGPPNNNQKEELSFTNKVEDAMALLIDVIIKNFSIYRVRSLIRRITSGRVRSGIKLYSTGSKKNEDTVHINKEEEEKEEVSKVQLLFNKEGDKYLIDIGDVYYRTKIYKNGEELSNIERVIIDINPETIRPRIIIQSWSDKKKEASALERKVLSTCPEETEEVIKEIDNLVQFNAIEKKEEKDNENEQTI